MNAAFKIVVYLAATLLLGALLSPWLYWAGQHASGMPGLKFLAETDFQRFFNRSMLISAFVLVIPILRWIGIHRLKRLGFEKNSHRFGHFFGGFFIAVGVMAGLGMALTLLGIFQLKDPAPFNLLPKVLLTALVVSLLEEILFRGAILGLVRQSFSPAWSTLFVSALFSVVHFLKPPEDRIQDVNWTSGFELLPQVFHQFSEPLLILGLFITLAILGLLLAHATLQTHSLWLPIGIHAGVIFGKMGFSKVAKRLQDVTPWFGSDLSIGIGSSMILLLLWLLIWLIMLRGRALPIYH